ncbi:MAG: GNAT family N-acetyltransferase [Rhodospirillales bacterium]|nr:GNAT family N-acetyltransferase [Rhodospirillales bacterium]
MPDGETRTVQVVGSIHDIPAADWDACAGADNPFLCHAFFAALEDSGSACAETGWLPRHLLIAGDGGHAVGCAPLYLKSHSYGEYVFDWGWAEAFQRAGGRYYPKLQAAVPFTPVTGPRLLVRAGAPAGTAEALAAAMVQLAKQLRVSSLHVTFHTRNEAPLFTRLGFLPRIGQQYHWRNEGYGSFEDFLAALSSRKRKAVRKERAEAACHGVRIRTLTGGEIEPRHWDAFHRFYLDTVERKWAHAYLTRGFFTLLGERMAEQVLLIVAEDGDGEPVAGALNLIGPDALYGRYWGSNADYRFLHFEACYYRAIDFAIANGLARVEAGAQGAHKIQRGYLPVATYSAHWVAEPGFRKAVAHFLDAERPAVEAEIEELAAASPFRRDGC